MLIKPMAHRGCGSGAKVRVTHALTAESIDGRTVPPVTGWAAVTGRIVQ